MAKTVVPGRPPGVRTRVVGSMRNDRCPVSVSGRNTDGALLFCNARAILASHSAAPCIIILYPFFRTPYIAVPRGVLAAGPARPCVLDNIGRAVSSGECGVELGVASGYGAVGSALAWPRTTRFARMRGEGARDGQSRGVAQLAARLHGVQEVRSSSLLTPTLPGSSMPRTGAKRLVLGLPTPTS